MSDNQSKINRIRELTAQLSAAARAYYAEDRELMSDREYDALYDELALLEAETGFSLPESPTQYVGYEAVERLEKEEHETPMLSLGKTKSREELQAFLGEKEGLLSWKLDGLTLVLTYNDGKLAKALTRGNGLIGEVVTANARVFVNLPRSIPFKGELVIRGEAVIAYSDFALINDALPAGEERFRNPRNLCSGSVRQLSSAVTAARQVRFFAFSLVRAEGVDFETRQAQLEFIKEQGLFIVDYIKVDAGSVMGGVEEYERRIASCDIPSDGLVLGFDDLAYSKSLGTTAKFPRDSIAFKWKDELRETRLLDIEWSPSRTGLINPVAIFEPVELEGTVVSRASVHNISVLRELALGIGDAITVYKANMIIPQIAENLTRSDTVEIPSACPVCGSPTQINAQNEAQTLLCKNPDCAIKKVKSFALLVSRDALNITGFSEATLTKFIEKGFIKTYAGIYQLERYRDEIVKTEGFGERSYAKIIKSIDESRKTELHRLIYGLGIAGIGTQNARLICAAFDYDLERLRNADKVALGEIDGIGEVIALAVYDYFHNAEYMKALDELLEELVIEEKADKGDSSLTNQTFVITGSLRNYSRSQLSEEIARRGGKVASAVSKKTTALINNDNTSASSKNKTAKELGIPILTEEEFLGRYF